MAGLQRYLADPPHLTVYLAMFSCECGLRPALEKLVPRLKVPRGTIRGWHVFWSDQLTSCHTLVYDLPRDSNPEIVAIQRQVVDRVAPLRDPEATRDRFATSWARLSAEEQRNVEEHGFPFAGANWHPHVTVASVAVEDWPAAWAALGGQSPAGSACFPYLSLYELREEVPALRERFILSQRSKERVA